MKRNLYKSMLLVLFSVFILGAPAFAAPELYDDFSGPYIEGAEWFLGDYRAFVREVAGGELVSKIGNAYAGYFRNRTAITDPTSINTIQCEITVEETVLDGIPPRASFARIDGFFYNTQDAGGATGDIYAAVYIGDRGNGWLEAWWEVYESLNDDLTNMVERGSGSLIDDPGILIPGIAYPAKIAYNGDDGFEFTVAGVSHAAVIGVDPERDAVTEYKGLTTGIDAEEGSGIGYASATFDDVFVNNDPYDDFSSAPLDQENWWALEFVREISGGKLRLGAQADEDFEGAYVQARYHTTPYLEATVLVETGSDVIGATGFARVRGFYYNDSRGPGSGKDYNGSEGDVFAYTGIMLHEGAALSAISKIYRCDDSGDWQEIFAHPFNTAINLDTEYTLSIEFTGTSLIFTCEDETHTYEITTPIYPPSTGQMRRLESWVFAEEEQSGHIKATFDDVYTGYTAQATYDATGTWDVTETDVWSSCDPNAQPETSTVTITQNGNDITLVDEDGNTFTGTVSGTYNNLYGEFFEQGGTRKISVTFSLSSSTSGNGLYYWTWTDGVIWCEGAGVFSFTKQAGPAPAAAGGGGGGGCFIDTAGSEFRR